MREHDYTEACEYLATLFGPTTTGNVEIRALPNERGAGRAAPLFTREPLDIETHCRRWDEMARGVFYGEATRRIGIASGKRADLAELPGLWADIDCLKLGLDKAVVIEALRTQLAMPPSVIVDSGHGIHARWLFRESLDIRVELPGAANLEADLLAALKQLAGICCGDIAVCDLARVMRLPSTHNTKSGDMVLCTVLEASWARYEWQELQGWLDWQRPVLEAPRAASVRASGDRASRARSNGHAPESDAFLKYAQTAGIKPPLDVGARLAAMEYLGAGDASVHQTQLHVSASMVAHGADDEVIVALLMAATLEKVGLAGSHWNWAREERNLREMIRSARAKFDAQPKPETSAKNPGQTPIDDVAEHEARTAPAAEVVNLAEQRRARGRPKKDAAAPAQQAKESLIAKTGEAVIDWWQDNFGRIAIVEAQLFTYAAGLWTIWDAGDHHTLKCGIQGVLGAAHIDPKTQLLNAVYRYIIERPELRADGVEWDATGTIVCQDATLKPRADGGWETVAHSPDHWASRRVEIRICDMAQGCLCWLAFLDGCFSDREPDEKAAVIACLQEWFGAAMVSRKPRELRKALWLHGESRTGKTRILEVLRALIGEPTSSMKLKSLTTHFGPSALIGKRAWTADDVVGPKDEVDDAAFKCVVTGEAFSTDVKGEAYATMRFDMPVAFSSNSLPRVKDQSDAVFNRSILIPMHVVRSEEETAGKPMIEDIVRASELAGVFAWSLEGWGRLVARGMFQQPASMREASEAFKDANNAALAWARSAIVAGPAWMVDRRDLYASFKTWFAAEHGEDTKPPTQRALTTALQQSMSVGHHVRDGYGLTTGIRMTDIGLRLRDDCPLPYGGGKRGSGRDSTAVNQLVPVRKNSQ